MTTPTENIQQIAKIAQVTSEIIGSVDTKNISATQRAIQGHFYIPILFTDSTVALTYTKWDTRPQIIVQRHVHPDVQAFAIYHALGDILLHWAWTPGVDLSQKVREYSNILDVFHSSEISSPDSDSTWESNEFAFEAILPIKAIQHRYPKATLTELSSKISTGLDITTELVYVRLKQLRKRRQI